MVFTTLKIHNLSEDMIILENMTIDKNFFFETICEGYYVILCGTSVCGIVPKDYHVLFAFDSEHTYEDLDIENMERLIANKASFTLLGYDESISKTKAIDSSTITEIKYVDNELRIPFTTSIFSNDGIFVVKQLASADFDM